ncbi:hypothetical protein TWF696_002326 [Orbilia brochopaga]|uniref:Uncharacterized protein n=1 Tax=Orbilia brochopaga TaxID=3140254 RepID=A0AAV9U4G8_9PEZI
MGDGCRQILEVEIRLDPRRTELVNWEVQGDKGHTRSSEEGCQIDGSNPRKEPGWVGGPYKSEDEGETRSRSSQKREQKKGEVHAAGLRIHPSPTAH